MNCGQNGNCPVCRRDSGRYISLCFDTDTKRGVTSEKIEAIDPETGDSLGMKDIGHEDTKPTSEESDAAARREAAGKFRNAQQVAVKLSMTIHGDPTILAKSIFELKNVGKRLSQRYYIRKATHKIEAGYTVDIKAVSDGTGGHSTKSKLAVGLTGIQVGPAAKGKRAPKEDEKENKDPQPLEEIEKIDPETGKTVKTYKDTQGRRKQRGDDYVR